MLRVDRYDDPDRGCLLIEIALCNDRETERKIPVSAWLYQTKLTVAGRRRRRRSCPPATRCSTPGPSRMTRCGGSTCSTGIGLSSPSAGPARSTGQVADGARRATEVWTTWLPTCETPQVTAEEIGRPARHAQARDSDRRQELRIGLGPIVERYAGVARRRGSSGRTAAPGPPAGRRAWTRSAKRGRCSSSSPTASCTCSTDREALRCFRFMNQVMADQRVQSQVARRRAQDPDESIEHARAAVLAAGRAARTRGSPSSSRSSSCSSRC